MEHIEKAALFVAVVKNGGFTAAGKALGLTNSAISKQVQLLEAALGVKLLHRTTRRVSTTEEGQIYYDRMAHVLEQAAEAEALISTYAHHAKGTLRVSIPAGFGHLYLREALVDFALKYPDITLCTSLSDRHVDIQAEGFDLAIRIGALADSSLVAKKLCEVPMTWVASPAYLKENGTPQKPADLKSHRLLGYNSQERPLEWRYRERRGPEQHISLKSTFYSDSGSMLLEAALKHAGLAILPTFFTQKYLEIGTLKAVLADYITTPERAIYAVMPPARHVPSKVRTFIDYIAAYMKKRPF